MPNSQSRMSTLKASHNWKFPSYFQSDRLPYTHQSQFSNSLLFIFAWYTFEAWLLIGQQDNCGWILFEFWLIANGSIDNKSFDNSDDDSKRDRKVEWRRWYFFILHRSTSMLACTNYRLIIKLTASTKKNL